MHTETGIHGFFDRLDSAAGITEYRHGKNGLRVLHVHDPTTPTATFMVTYLVGSRHEKPGLTGATHFLEHLMFKGTDRHNRDAGSSVFQVLQRLGAQVNATTWLDRTNYYAMLPSGHVETAISVESDRMRGARIRPEDVDDERSVILNELDRGENDPVRRLYQAVYRTAFEVHPYGHPTIGLREDVASVSSEALRSFYDTYYWPDNAVVSLIGDVDAKSGLDLVDRHFGSIPAAPAAIPAVSVVEPAQDDERRVSVRMAGEPPLLMMAWKSPPGTSRTSDALSLLSMVLSAGRLGRLYRVLVDTGMALSQSATAGRFRDPGLFSVFVMLAPGTEHEAAETVVRESLRDLVENGVTRGEIERARTQLRAYEAFGRDGPFAVAAQLNEAVAAGDWRLFATARERIGALDSDDVMEAACRVLVDRSLTVGTFVPTAG